MNVCTEISGIYTSQSHGMPWGFPVSHLICYDLSDITGTVDCGTVASGKCANSRSIQLIRTRAAYGKGRVSSNDRYTDAPSGQMLKVNSSGMFLKKGKQFFKLVTLDNDFENDLKQSQRVQGVRK